MTRQLAVLVMLAACGGSKTKAAGKDAASAGADAAVAARGPELGFVTGEVAIAEEHDGHVVVTRVLAGGGWTAIDGGGASVFPSAATWRGGLLVIAAEGETEADHVEQLAVVRGTAIERFGPQVQLVRNPVVVGDVLIVETNQHGFRELYRDGTARLTANREGNFEPALSPDGKVVAFASSRDGDSEIYRMAVDGSQETRLTAFHRDDWSPVWSPDGKTIVFLSDREGRPRVFAMNPDGTGQRRHTAETDPDVIEDLPRFAPDGRLAYLRGKELHVDGKRVADGVKEYAWSPDGAWLAVVGEHLTFVRIADGHTVVDERVRPLLVRWR